MAYFSTDDGAISKIIGAIRVEEIFYITEIIYI